MRTWLRRRRNRWIAGAATLAIAAGAAIAIGSSSLPRQPFAARVAHPEVPAITATGPAPHEVPSIISGIAPGRAILTSTVNTLDVFDAPNGAVTREMSQHTYYSSPLTLMAIEDGDVAGTTWYQVLLPAKPNGQTGWVRASDVSVTSTDT